MYVGYGITFDSAGSWSFDNDIARNVIMFGVDNSSSSRADNCKNIFLELSEGLIFAIKEGLVHQIKSLVLILVKETGTFAWIYIIMLIKVICLLMEKRKFKFKDDNKNVHFPTRLCIGSISNGFSAAKSREVYLYGNVSDFSVDYSSIDKLEILNIHKYLMITNNVK